MNAYTQNIHKYCHTTLHKSRKYINIYATYEAAPNNDVAQNQCTQSMPDDTG